MSTATIINRTLSLFCLLLVAWPAESARAEVPLSDQLPSPVAYWSFDECLPQTVRDDSGGEATGQRRGAVGCAEGRVRGAGDFDGVDDAVEVPHRPSLQGGNAVTLAAWVKADDLTGTSTIIGKWYAGDAYLLGISSGKFSFSVAFGQSKRVQVVVPATRQWTHIAGTYNGSSAKLYINGVLKASKAAAGSLQRPSASIHIGRHPSRKGFSGSLDEIRLYHTALTATHIKKLVTGQTYTVVPYYIYPSDQPRHEEYVTAIEALLDELQVWYRQHSGVSFRRAPLRVVQGADYVTMRCGPSPTEPCRDDPRERPNWGDALIAAIGNFPERAVTLIFSQGAGGFAGANLTGTFGGYAIVGDWVLEPISGVREPEAVHCGYAEWQCKEGVPKGTVAHELGHAFGLHHPVNYPVQSIMGWHGEYPSPGFTPYERQLLQLNPMLSAGVHETANPMLAFENPDEVHWGDTLSLAGSGFSGTPAVQFVDGSRAVQVAARLVNSTTLSVKVPSNLSGGFVRVRQGTKYSNAVPINFYP